MNGSSDNQNNLDEILDAIRSGDPEAMNELITVVHDELRRLAHSKLRPERRRLTLQTTVLVNEAYINLAASSSRNWESPTHFFRVAAIVMRHILIQHARKRMSLKRGEEPATVSTDEIENIPDEKNIPDFEKAEDLVRLDEALRKLEAFDQILAEVVENRFFMGRSVEETAEVMNISAATVKRKWAAAKARLYREMKR